MPNIYIPGLATLRDYQQRAVENTLAALEADKCPVVVAPTGSGKSIIASAIATALYKLYRCRYRIVCIVPTRELAAQNEAAHTRLDQPNKPSVGVLCAGLNRRETNAGYVITTINSFHTFVKNGGFKDDKPLILMFDEAHRVGWNERSMARKIIKETNPRHVIGLTATPYRGDDNRRLDQSSKSGIPPVFDTLLPAVSTIELIRRGMLVPLRVDNTFAGRGIDTSGVRTKNGEYVSADLEKAALREENLNLIIEVCKAAFEKEHQVLAFTPTVGVAKAVHAKLRKIGIPAAPVYGSMRGRDRDATITAWRSRGGVLLNCAVLTTGFDAPEIRAIVNARPTKRRALFVQIVGRGMRPAPGKTECALYDLGGCVDRFGVIDEIALVPPAADRQNDKKHKQSSKKPKDIDPLAKIKASEASGKIGVGMDSDKLLKNPIFSSALELATTQTKANLIKRIASGISKFSTEHSEQGVNVVFCRHTSSAGKKGSSTLLREPLPETAFPVARLRQSERAYAAVVHTAMFSVTKTYSGVLTPVVVLLGDSELSEFAYRIYPHAYNRELVETAGRVSLSLALATVCQKLTGAPKRHFLGRDNRFLLAAVLATIIEPSASIAIRENGDAVLKIGANLANVKHNSYQMEE